MSPPGQSPMPVRSRAVPNGLARKVNRLPPVSRSSTTSAVLAGRSVVSVNGSGTDWLMSGLPLAWS